MVDVSSYKDGFMKSGNGRYLTVWVTDWLSDSSPAGSDFSIVVSRFVVKRQHATCKFFSQHVFYCGSNSLASLSWW